MNTKEVVGAIEAILHEKKIDRSKLSEIVESIFKSIIKKKYKIENEDVDQYFTVTFNIDNGDVEIIHDRIVVEDKDFEDELSQVKYSDALKIDEDAEIGEELPEIIDFNTFGRRHIVSAKQILVQKIRRVEKMNLLENFKDKIGEIINGTIHQITNKEIKINYEDAELILPRSEQVFNERYRRGELLKVLVVDAYEKNQDVRIIVSRVNSGFIKRLFEIEVPEVSDGVINILHVGRRAGIRTKIVLESLDPRVDPVGACVGQKGARISAIVSELNKEKVDIVQYVNESRLYITRLLGIKVEFQLEVNEEEKIAEVVVPDEIKYDVLGYKNSNLELAEELSGFKINLLSESEFEVENELKIENVEELSVGVITKFTEAGYVDAESVLTTSIEDLVEKVGLTEEEAKNTKEIIASYYEESQE